MSKHTPGPWFVGEDESTCPDHKDSGLAVIDTGRSGDFEIAQHVEWNNAHLIAAAPDLLEACKALVDALVRYGEDVDGEAPSSHSNMMSAARAAVAKAEGRT